MDIGISLPTMAPGHDRTSLVSWCRGLDDTPFSSVSAGERITFDNPEMFTTLGAAAALTERVRVFANLVVLPWHSMGLVTKQLLTLAQLAPGRLDVGVGVGGREEDYRAVGAPFTGRHARLDAAVEDLCRLWEGAVPEGASAPIGPRPTDTALPRLLAGAMGPKAMARAARWADGVSGFSIAGDADEMASTFRLAEDAWATEGRPSAPRLVTGCFFALGPDAPDRLRTGVARYLHVFGAGFAEKTAAGLTAHDPATVAEIIQGAREAGADEFILVPMSTDPACRDEAAAVAADA